MRRPRIQWTTQPATAVSHNDITVTPQSDVLHIELPFGGFVWQRPAAVVIDKNGRSQTQPIVDVTRTAVWKIWGMAVVVMLIGWLVRRG